MDMYRGIKSYFREKSCFCFHFILRISGNFYLPPKSENPDIYLQNFAAFNLFQVKSQLFSKKKKQIQQFL